MKYLTGLFICFLIANLSVAQIKSTSFSGRVNFTCGSSSSSPIWPEVSDIDGDGKTDIITTTQGDHTLNIFRNQSINGVINASTLAPEVTFPLPPSATGISNVAVDLELDGKPDIIVANYSTHNISIFQNTSSPGNINFATRADYNSGTNPAQVKTADLDNDGRQDIVTVNFGTNTFSVFQNNSSVGTIILGSRQDFTVSGSVANAPREFTIDDFDGDNKPDIAVLYYNGHVGVFRNTSTIGVISFASSVNYPAVNLNAGICSGDIDGDGKADIVVSNYISGTMLLFRNTNTVTGTMSFASFVSITTGSQPHYNMLIDLDNDGKKDLVVGNRASNTISLFRNTATSGVINTNSFAPRIDYVTGSIPVGTNFADLDGDNKSEMICISSGSATLHLYKNKMGHSGLIGYFPFSNTPNDASGYENHGTAHIATTSTTDKNNLQNNAYYFNSTSNAYIQTSVTQTYNISDMPAFSTSLWIKADNTVSAPANRVIYHLHDGARIYELFYNYTSQKLLIANWNGIASTFTINSVKTLTPGNWYHIAVVTDTTTNNLKVYINDTLDINQAVTLSKPRNSALYIGKHNPNSWNFSGTIDEVRLYNKALTPSEVHDLYINYDQPLATTLHYYSKATGDLSQLSSWGTNTDGTGTQPLTFDSSNVIYHVRNNVNPILGGTLNISGINSILEIGDGINTFNLAINQTESLICDSIYINSNITLTVTGNLISQKIGSGSSSTVQYLGSSAQLMAAGTYYNLAVTGSVKTLTGNTRVTNNLAMFQSINCSSFDLVLGTGTSNTGTLTRSGGTITGRFTRWFNNTINSGSTGLFPVGSATRYAPLQIEYTSAPTTGGTISVEFITSAPGNIGLPLFDFSVGAVFIDKAAPEGYWQVSNSGITAGTFSLTASANNFNGVNNFANLRLIRRAIGGSWSLQGTAGTNTGSNSSAGIIRSGLTTLNGQYGIAGDQSENPLPVKLLRFLCEKAGHYSELHWETSFEFNNRIFEIERSTDHITFENIGTVAGSGNTSRPHTYTFRDNINSIKKAQIKTILYRLKQIDYDGSFEYSNIISIQLDPEEQDDIDIYPNPSEHFVTIDGLKEPAVMFDMTGNKVLDIPANGRIDISKLSTGVYMIRSGSRTRKLIRY